MLQKEVQSIGEKAIQQVATHYRGAMNIHFRASTTSAKDANLLQVFIAYGDNTHEKVYNWGTLAHDDYQLTDSDLEQMLETFVDRCVMDFWSTTNNDLATLAQWRDRISVDETR